MMAPIATADAGKQGTRSKRRPAPNLFDVPEVFLPVGHSTASGAQRDGFEARCRMIHHNSVDEEQRHENKVISMEMSTKELEVMFPVLDVALVRCISSDSSTPQRAIETLLALSASMSEPVVGVSRPHMTKPFPCDFGLEDHQKFPSLVDADGWQVVNRHILDQDPNEDLGNTWASQVKAAAEKPAPEVFRSRCPPRRQENVHDVEVASAEEWLPLGEYETRHMIGQRRAKNRRSHGHGKGNAGSGGRGAAGGSSGGAMSPHCDSDVCVLRDVDCID